MNRIVCLYGALLFLLSQTKPSRQVHLGNSLDDFTTEESVPSTPDDASYVVGVVEFRPEAYDMDIRRRTERHLEAYKQLIRSAAAKSTDIIVFPELTLNSISDPVYVPDPAHNEVPCQDELPDLLSQLSCLAAQTRKYIVINLAEIFDCDSVPEEDPRPCGPHGFHRYNTNVVFDRNGAVIARYRKFNLFGEVGTNRTHLPEIVTFETDFGVTFGLFTCFDVLFAKPALELVKRDVSDFVLPSMWISELPFLTATQLYESWAYANNVNLIVAGANFNTRGSTGTGVFNGRNGAVLSVMTGEPTIQLFPVRVPKIGRNLKPNDIPVVDSEMETGRLHGKFLEDISMLRDFLYEFTTMQINPERIHDHIGQIICNGNFCCDFSVDLTVLPDREVTHYYRFAVFDGTRTFSGFADAHVSTCGIITCRNQSLTSCGLPMHENSNYLEFNEITISGKFRANGTLAMPNSLDDMLHSLDVDKYSFYSSINYTTNQQNVQLSLSSSVANLQTFAIYAINHKNFEYFNPLEEPPEPTTESPSTAYSAGSEEDSDGGAAQTVRTSIGLLLMVLVSAVLQL